jgi:hypothetical protein
MKLDLSPKSIKPEQWILIVAFVLLAGAAGYRIVTDTPPSPFQPKTSGSLPEIKRADEFAGGAKVVQKPGEWTLSNHSVFIPRLIVFYPENEEIAVLDMDDEGPDGIKFSWKRQFGFPLDDPSVAQADPDRDGFTNLEEYRYGTDPTDRESSPPFISKLCVADFNPVSLSIILRGYSPSPQNPGTYEYQINLPELRVNKSRRVLTGDTIEGYSVGEFRQKIVERVNPRTGILEKIDESELDVLDPRLGRTITLVMNVQQASDESSVKFNLPIPDAVLEPSQVSIGQKFRAQDKEFQLRSASAAGAVIRDLETNADIEIPRCGGATAASPAAGGPADGKAPSP